MTAADAVESCVMNTTPPNDPYQQISAGPAPDHILPAGRVADGGGVFRALIAIAGALFFLFISLGFVGYAIYLTQAGKPESGDKEQTEKAGGAEGETAKESEGETGVDTDSPPELQLVSAAAFPDVIGNVYVFCMVKYTGDKKATYLRVDAVLTDNDGGEVAKGFGYSLLSTVEPGQTVPVSVLVKKPGEYTKIKTRLSYRPGNAETVKLELSNTRLTTTPSIYIEGTLTNVSVRPAGGAHVVGIIYDAAGTACGAGSGYVTSKELAPGTGEPFKAYMHPQKCKPVRFEVLAEATAK